MDRSSSTMGQATPALNTAQSQAAVALLREALDWVGLVELTDEEEEKTEDLQLRIERLLTEIGALRGRTQDRTLLAARRYLLLQEEVLNAILERERCESRRERAAADQQLYWTWRQACADDLLRELETQKSAALVALDAAMAGEHRCGA